MRSFHFDVGQKPVSTAASRYRKKSRNHKSIIGDDITNEPAILSRGESAQFQQPLLEKPMTASTLEHPHMMNPESAPASIMLNSRARRMSSLVGADLLGNMLDEMTPSVAGCKDKGTGLNFDDLFKQTTLELKL